jgi:ABC-2 type transport system ATP-binding protein
MRRMDTDQEAAIVVDDLRKRYSENQVDALAGLSFTVGRGEVFALLGPNGAGKTTTVGVLTTLIRPTGGRATVAGADVVSDPIAVRMRMAVVPQQVNLDRAMTIRENLTYHAAYHGMPHRQARRRADEMLGRFELSGRADDKVGYLSGGQAQRIIIARALMHRPDVLFCDEPTRGLDRAARVFLWEQIEQIRGEGTAVLLTTHDMIEAETLADRVGIIDHGALVTVDTPAALTRQMRGSQAINVSLRTDKAGDDGYLAALAALDGVAQVKVLRGDGSEDDPMVVRMFLTEEASALMAPIVRALEDRRVAIQNLTGSRASLEDVFLHFTGRSLR